MGIFHVDCEIVNATEPAKAVSISKLMVDTGSELSWIPENDLKKAGIAVAKKDVSFLMANGQNITRSIGYAIVRAQGSKQ